MNKDLYPIQRFKVAGYLSRVERANYKAISEGTGLSYSEISKSVKILEERGYLSARKQRSGRYSETIVELSQRGRSEVKLLVRTLRSLAAE